MYLELYENNNEPFVAFATAHNMQMSELLEFLENLEDIAIAEKRLQDREKNPVTIPHDEFWAEFGL